MIFHMWSYYTRPDYPLYVAIATNRLTNSDKLKSYVTVTVNTDRFKPSKNMRSFKIVDNVITG